MRTTVNAGGTVVFGDSGDTPVALVCEASRSSQEVITGTVGTVLDKINGRELPHLYVIYVGQGLVSALSA